MATYWIITAKILEEHPVLVDLIFPLKTNTTNNKHSYHIPHTHPNATMIALALPAYVKVMTITPIDIHKPISQLKFQGLTDLQL